MFINLATLLERSRVNGPGERTVIWVQGCPIRCKGCFNTEMWPFEPKTLVEVDTLANHILGMEGIEGVTFSGGEPFAQAPALGKLGEILRRCGLNIIIFTGYTLEQLQETHHPDWTHLLSITDLLIAGPFIPELRCDLPLRSSSNQRLIALTDRLQDHPDLKGEITHATEFTIEPDGTTVITGFPDGKLVEAISHSLTQEPARRPKDNVSLYPSEHKNQG